MGRTFTSPLTYPKDYETERGDSATIVARMPDNESFIGYICLPDGGTYSHIWGFGGVDDEMSAYTIFDIQRKRVVYREFGVLGRHKIECNTDGSEATVVFEKAGSYI